jgi:type III secretion protein J
MVARCMTSSRAPLLLVLAGLLLAPACSIRLQHDLTEVDANEIYVLLQRNSIDAEKVKEGEGKEASFVISVPRADVATAAELLRAYSLPRPKADGLAIFKMTKGMIPTQTEERAMFIEALGGEVSNALSRIPGVLEVRTIVMIPEANDLAQPEHRPQPSASVMIKYMATEAEKSPIPEEEVRTFVAGAVPDLKPERVNVLMKPAKFVSGPTPEATS